VAYLFVVMNFYVGVIALVALSLTVMAGLLSTDRLVLRIGHRVLLQGVHRATAVVALVALGVHVAVKVLEAHAALGDAVVPFFSQGRSLFIGFGTIASYLLLLAVWSGMARTRFIGRVRRWVWRLLHGLGYLSWPVAVLHGLNAGRQAATWVTMSYVVCLVLVGLGLVVRIATRFGRYAGGVKPTRAMGVNTRTVVMPRIPGGYGTGQNQAYRDRADEDAPELRPETAREATRETARSTGTGRQHLRLVTTEESRGRHSA
jgi:hypothetical protein